jgi:hypothetical protein
MDRRFPSYNDNWTKEDRMTCARWRRRIAVFYGCMAFLILGFIVLSKWSSVPTNEARDHQGRSAGLQGERR